MQPGDSAKDGVGLVASKPPRKRLRHLPLARRFVDVRCLPPSNGMRSRAKELPAIRADYPDASINFISLPWHNPLRKPTRRIAWNREARARRSGAEGVSLPNSGPPPKVDSVAFARRREAVEGQVDTVSGEAGFGWRGGAGACSSGRSRASSDATSLQRQREYLRVQHDVLPVDDLLEMPRGGGGAPNCTPTPGSGSPPASSRRQPKIGKPTRRKSSRPVRTSTLPRWWRTRPFSPCRWRPCTRLANGIR